MVALATDLCALDGAACRERRALAPWARLTNITVLLDNETYRRARMKAAEQDTSVSALVRNFLTTLQPAKTKTSG